MKAKHFLDRLDHDKIVAAIAHAEQHTSGEIRVFVSHRRVKDPLTAAAVRFEKLQMNKTKHRNAVLIFVAPPSQVFSIIGDAAVHAKCGDLFWKRVASELGDFFRERKFTEGIVHAIQIAGKLLAEHFPRSAADKNELPDSVVDG